MAPRRSPASLPCRPARRQRIGAAFLLLALPTTWSIAAHAEGGTAQAAAASKTPATSSTQASRTAREQQAVDSAKRRQAEAERAGQAGLARRLAALSARWHAVIEALEAAAKLEAEAASIEDERIRVQEQTDRLISLVEQTEARRARALARLQALGLEPTGAGAGVPAEAKPTEGAR